MSLKFYIGASGAGKSTGLYREIIERSIQEPKRNFILIVPDQFSMQTQMDLVTMHPQGGIMNIDVLSFSRLAHRIFDEVGGGDKTVLDDTGKSLVLRRLASGLKEKTPVIGGNLNKTGYIHEVKSAVSEFMQYGIGTGELTELTEYAKERGRLYFKLKDLNVLYQGFLDFIKERDFITTEETLELLRQALPKSAIVRDSVIAFDGFTGFTPVQNGVIAVLMRLAREVIVTVVMDGRENPADCGDDQNLFHLSKKTVASLCEMAKNCRCGREQDVVLQGDPVPRFAQNPVMSHLEKNLFRYPLKAYRGGDAQERLRIMQASSPQEEVRQVCVAIRRYMRKTGCCYRDIAVIAGDLSAYANFIENQFSLYGIPIYLDETRGIVLNPFTEYLKSALQIVTKNFSYEAVFHYIRSGLADFEPCEADRLENYVLALNIRGRRRWKERFIRRTEEMAEGEEELEALNASREKLMRQLEPLFGRFDTTAGLVEALYGFIIKNQVQQKLKGYEDRFKEEGDLVKAREYAQIYRLVMDLLDQMMDLIGDEPVRMDEFAKILEAGFGEIQVGTIPQNVDRVVAGDMERTRLKQVKALFFVGVNDGYIPKNAGTGGIISDMDREFLAGSGKELAPTPRQQMFIQKLYLYMNMTKPSDRLYLSYSRMNAEGNALRPAYLIDTICRLFPGVRITMPELDPASGQVQGVEDGRGYLAGSLRKYADGLLEPEKTSDAGHETVFGSIYPPKEEEEDFRALIRLYQKADADWLESLLQAAFYTYREHPLGKAAAVALYGSMLSGSVSRLERFSSCAYAHFLQYGLALKEREQFGFEAVDLGNVFHAVLELFGEKLKEHGYTWFDFPKEEGDRLVEEAVESFAVGYGGTILYDNARNEYMITRIKRILKRTVSTLQYQLCKGKFRPEQMEVSFSVLEELDAVNIALTEQEKMRLRGRIDRMDVCEEDDRLYVKVIDYKSGSKDFSLAALYYGLQLQLVVYMNAAVEMEQKLHPEKKVVPAAMLYYRVQDPMLSVTEEMTPEELNRQILSKLRTTGIVNQEDAVVEKLDTELNAKSDVIPVERKRDGSYSARSSVLSEDDMNVISEYVNRKIREIGREILDGKVSLNPYLQRGGGETKSACTYCPFSRVCGFDSRIPGLQARQLEELDEEQAMERIREECGKEEKTWR